MPERLLVPAEDTSREIRVVNSRFIAYASRAENIEDAREILERIRRENSTANHHVPVFVIGHGKSVIEHCSDAGEPAGTAGRPALTVVKGSGIGDIAVVVVRYFGGTKLGTGGLVRAYTDAVKSVLADLPLAEKVVTQTVRLTCPYGLYQRMVSIIEAQGGQLENQDFGAEVTLTARFRAEAVADFSREVKEASRGSLVVEPLDGPRLAYLPLPVQGL